jgi:outer membrane receptor protein involved in Fe transport
MIRPSFFPSRRFATAFLPALWLGLGLLLAVGPARAEPVEFNLPAQPAADALLAFSKQARLEVLFSYDDLRKVQSSAVTGRFEPADALVHLLRDTGLTTRRNEKGKFVVTPARRVTGSIRGRLLTADNLGARGIVVVIPALRRQAVTDRQGQYEFAGVPVGTYRLAATGPHFHSLQLDGVQVDPDRMRIVETQTLQPLDEVTHLEPFMVVGESVPLRLVDRSPAELAPRSATGNLDLLRTVDDALPFVIYDRDQIIRSGVVNLNEFFQREVLDTYSAAPPLEQDGKQASFLTGSTNLDLRGYGAEGTVVLVDGRRLPESVDIVTGRLNPPDVNLIPLSLVQQIQVLPVSASALYSGNAVGGVINIILRPEAETTEVTVTHTNSLRGFDAPQSSVSLQHGQSLLNGALRLRLSATFAQVLPPTESELNFRQRRVATPVPLTDPVYRATPNVRSADASPLFASGLATVTSVAPGADGTGGLAAFAGREGVRNLDYFDGPGGLAASINSVDNPFGRKQRRTTYFGSVTYDPSSWLQVGADGSYSRTEATRGFDVLSADLSLAATSPFNPFGRDVNVALNETAMALGQDYGLARIESYSLVLAALVKLPAAWVVSLDAQYARNTARYRGLSGADASRWQELVDQGRYNPLRDTQVHGPPPEFYDRVLAYFGGPGRFVTLGDYDTLDATVRVTNEALNLPTGQGAVNFGGDYRRNHLAPYDEVYRFADGTLAQDPVHWTGRALQRLSVFGEMRGPLLPVRWLPRWLKAVEGDLAVRYVSADTAKETNVAPTFGLKVDFAGGVTVRGSVTTSNRFPTPAMSRPVRGGTGGGGGRNLINITDPVRSESYDIQADIAVDPDLNAEAAVTQTAGIVLQRGTIHRIRVSLDFADTRKTNELGWLDVQKLVNLESSFPERVTRAPPAPGDLHSVGRITSALTGAVNLASRHSQNWSASLDYTWTKFPGGSLELYSRFAYFQRYQVKLFPASPMVDELGSPDGVTGVLRYRANFGAGWSNRQFGLGLDGHYFHSRVLPAPEWSGQGSDRIKPYWQFDAYVQSDLTRWLPWKTSRFGLRGQLRVNNISGFDFPKYVYDSTGAGVQPYGDWRGRTYSLSLTATF